MEFLEMLMKLARESNNYINDKGRNAVKTGTGVDDGGGVSDEGEKKGNSCSNCIYTLVYLLPRNLIVINLRKNNIGN